MYKKCFRTLIGLKWGFSPLNRAFLHPKNDIQRTGIFFRKLLIYVRIMKHNRFTPMPCYKYDTQVHGTKVRVISAEVQARIARQVLMMEVRTLQ